MDFANRGNRPNQAPQNTAGPMNEQPSQPFQPMNVGGNKKAKGGGMSLAKIGSIFMLFAVCALLIAVLVGLVFGGDAGKDEADLIDTSKYQAVFLDSQDGQVYFGKLEVYNLKLYRLTDIFYVRVEQPIQPEGADAANSQANISLAKLGVELHGPQDAMYVARDKVLYWENLKDVACVDSNSDGTFDNLNECSQVFTAIKTYIDNGRQTPTDSTQQQQSSTPATEDTTATQPTGTETQTDTPTDTTTPTEETTTPPAAP